MKIRVVVVVVALACLAGYVATVSAPPAPAPAPKTAQQLQILPAGVAALSGVWEGVGPDALPMRLVVEDLHENWAVVLYTWGDQPDGMFQKGWVRVRAKVLPGGKLFWQHPGDFTFQLSDDRTTLVGTREQGGLAATSLMRRVPSDVALTALTQEGSN